MAILLWAAILGIIPAVIVKNKSKSESFIGWWIYGALIFIVALPHAILWKPKKEDIDAQRIEEGMKKCPFCAEWIQKEAKVCRYCNRDLTSLTREYVGSGQSTILSDNEEGLAIKTKAFDAGWHETEIPNRQTETAMQEKAGQNNEKEKMHKPNPNLTKCPDCGENVSKSAFSCPRCGKQLQKPERSVAGKVFLWTFYLFNAFMAWWLFSGLGNVSKEIGTPMSEAEMVGASIGIGIGVTFILSIWVVGAIITGLLALMTRPKA